MSQRRTLTHFIGLFNDKENQVLTGIGLAVLAGFLFVTSDTVVKVVREDLPVAMVVWGRFIMHLLLMFVLFPGRKIIPLLKVNNPKLIIGRGLLLLTCTCLFFHGNRLYWFSRSKFNNVYFSVFCSGSIYTLVRGKSGHPTLVGRSSRIHRNFNSS